MSSHQAEPLLPQHQQQNSVPPPDAGDGSPPDDAAADRLARSVTWITALGFVLFTLNCVMAVYWYQDGQSFNFVSYLNLLALIVCLKRYEKAELGSQLRSRLKVAVRLLAMALALLFSYKVVTVMPPAVAVVACLMAVGAAAGMLYYF
ncbi:hypothetical protein EJB05_24814, partial [Eragrostis curvula]